MTLKLSSVLSTMILPALSGLTMAALFVYISIVPPAIAHLQQTVAYVSRARVVRGVARSRLVSLPVMPAISRMRRNTASKSVSDAVPSSTTRSQRPLVVWMVETSGKPPNARTTRSAA